MLTDAVSVCLSVCLLPGTDTIAGLVLARDFYGER